MDEQEVFLTQNDLDLLYEVSTSIHSIEDLDSMLRSVLNKIKAVFGIEGASIALHDARAGEFFFIQTAEEQICGLRPQGKVMRFPDDYGVAGWVLHEKRAVTIPDVSKDERFTDSLSIQQEFITRSMICVPLMTRKGVIGVLYALNKLSGAFTRKETYLLEILSASIAIAVENAMLYGEVKQYAASLEMENLRLMSEVRDRFNLQGIVGSSEPMRRVFDLLDKAVKTDTTVFLQGETGTGKELLAKTIHYSGNLKNRPFIAENCGALSENLLESELFGHVKGAFTGAISDKKGLFELADGGTVFLDEIADMTHAMQTKLLRVLQESQVRPVGGNSYHTVRFRLITSSNRDLTQEVKSGNFRSDLFYRIHVFPILLPPLRSRKEDIPLLADFFLKKMTKRFRRPPARLTPAAIEMLSQFDWPGNIRELENEIERALTLAGDAKEITISHLSEKIAGPRNQQSSENAEGLTLKEATARIERRMIESALGAAGGNRSQAARVLGITRQGLLNKIARYKLSRIPANIRRR